MFVQLFGGLQGYSGLTFEGDAKTFRLKHYSWMCVWGVVAERQQADFTVMYTNSEFNKAELQQSSLFTDWTEMCSCSLLSPLSESVTEVRTNIYVTSFGPVSDTDMVSMCLCFPLILPLSTSESRSRWLVYYFYLKEPALCVLPFYSMIQLQNPHRCSVHSWPK